MSSRRSQFVSIGSMVAALAVVAGCTSNAHHDTSATSGHNSSASSSSESKAPAAPAVLAVHPLNGSHNISPSLPITAAVTGGTITKASLVSSTGKVVTGLLATGGASWKAAEDLGYGKTYTLRVSAQNPDGKVVSKISTFTTVTPNNLTLPYLQTLYNQGLTPGTYGVGMVISVHFDEPITNRAAAEKAITVTSSPAVTGAFYWVNDEVVHWRPAKYWTPGTKVTVAANLYGVQVGDGLWGQDDKATHFTIGPSHVTIADDSTYQVKSYTNGKLVHTMPTAMGLHMTVPGKNGPISLWTPQGTYTVMAHNPSVVMDSESFGLPHKSPWGYKETIYWATRISNGGIFLHELDTTVWAQGHQDISHGCLNLNHANAVWFYNYSLVGDPVKVVNTHGPTLSVDDGGDWTLPWSQWVKGGVNKN